MIRFSFFDMLSRMIMQLFLCVWFGGIFYIIGSNIFNRYKEKQAYSVMVTNPSDFTVNNYIQAFEKINGFSAMIFNMVLRSKFSEDKARQAQGYYIIEDSTMVSAEVKEELKMIFLANGVPIN